MRYRKQFRRLVKFLFPSAVLCLLVLISSGEKGKQLQNYTPIDQVKPAVVRIGYLKGLPLHFVKIQGSLEKRLASLGISIGWSEFLSVPQLLEVLKAGDIDFGSGADAPLVFGQSANVPFVYAMAGRTRSKSLAFVIREESNIRDIADLKGKKVAYGKGWNIQYLLVKALEADGLKIEDIKSVYVKSSTEGFAAFESGQIDALAVSDPYYALLHTTENNQFIIDENNLSAHREFFITSSSFSQKRPDLLKVILEEQENTNKWMNKNPREVAKMLATQLKVDVNILEMSTRHRTYGLQKINEKIIAEQQEIADIFYRLGVIPKPIQVKDAVVNNPPWIPDELR